MINFFESLINTGNYSVSEMEEILIKARALGKLTNDELEELLSILNLKANNSAQVDLYNAIVDLQKRVYALEHPTDIYVIWEAGYTTTKGEIVRYDITGDGEYNLCLYDGGRTQTALGIGAINGWYEVDVEGNKTGVIVRNADKKSWTITPIEN